VGIFTMALLAAAGRADEEAEALRRPEVTE